MPRFDHLVFVFIDNLHQFTEIKNYLILVAKHFNAYHMLSIFRYKRLGVIHI